MSKKGQAIRAPKRYSFSMHNFWKQLLLGVIAALLVGTVIYLFISGRATAPAIIPHNGNSSVKVSVAPNGVADIAHIFIIMDENKSAASIVGNNQAPYINSLIDKYGLATNYSAVTHPSLPNYLALTSGSTDGITTDCNPPSAGCIVNVNNIANQVQGSGRTWKEYAESMPQACYAENSGNYATKHNPFVYYQDIIGNSSLCNTHVVPYSQLSSDLKSTASTPNFAFITPNLCNDMHNCSISTGDSWLSDNVPAILHSPAFTSQPSLLIITWDEGYASDNNVATIFAGSAAKQHYQSNAAFNHYSILHTIEDVWGLKPLTANAANAPLMTSFII